ncbi:LPD7 domain-containing protein [Rhodoblastus sp.]|uniref:LPD7 domain-containing protein n=1 Tax=Rhodoblastus sp. TaxID=1962975 RepID=UPI003F999F8A
MPPYITPPLFASSNANGAPASVRAPEAARRGVAAGAQSAVVKIASFAGGRARVKALLSYQSRDSEIPFEADDGAVLTGEDTFDELADRWLEHNRESAGRVREPSKDVVYFTLRVSAEGDVSATTGALSQALDGHKYAFRFEETAEGVDVHVVASAASAVKENGKAIRLFDTRKSLLGFEQRFAGAFGVPVELNVKRWAHGVDGAGALLCRLTRDGEVAATLYSGKELSTRSTNWAVANSWKRALRSREVRDVAHVILSAKPGTDKQAFVDASRAMLAREFAGHEYVFALHTDRDHLHVHAAVKMVDAQGRRMHPNIADLRRWRETMAQEARLQQIPMEAMSRFEQARAPAYGLGDARMVARGTAPEVVRRRVEAVRTNAVYVPVRAEGHARAAAAVAGWRVVSVAESANDRATEVRHRVETAASLGRRRMESSARQPGPVASTAASVRPVEAAAFAKAEQNRSRTQIESMLKDFVNSYGAQTAALTALSRAVSDEMRPVVLRAAADTERQSAQFEKHRAALVDAMTKVSEIDAELPKASEAKRRLLNDAREKYSEGIKAVVESDVAEYVHLSSKNAGVISDQAKTLHKFAPNAEIASMNIEQARSAIQAQTEALDTISRTIPAEFRSKFDEAREKLRIASATFNAEAERQAQARTAFVGDSYVKPRDEPLQGYVHEKVKVGQVEEVRYSHLAADGTKGALAFVDKGQSVVVQDWKSEATVREAMKLSAEKWGSITLTGNEAYKATALRLAAEHGYEITNPELQERFAAEKARIAGPRAQGPRFAAGGTGRMQEPNNLTIQSGVSPSSAAPAQAHTPAERQVRLELLRERVVREAERETNQANVASALGETNRASGDAEHPYRSQAEARAAREAARADTNDPSRPMPTNISESEAIQQARFEQQKLLPEKSKEQPTAPKSAAEQIREFNEQELERQRAREKERGQER